MSNSLYEVYLILFNMLENTPSFEEEKNSIDLKFKTKTKQKRNKNVNY